MLGKWKAWNIGGNESIPRVSKGGQRGGYLRLFNICPIHRMEEQQKITEKHLISTTWVRHEEGMTLHGSIGSPTQPPSIEIYGAGAQHSCTLHARSWSPTSWSFGLFASDLGISHHRRTPYGVPTYTLICLGLDQVPCPLSGWRLSPYMGTRRSVDMCDVESTQ